MKTIGRFIFLFLCTATFLFPADDPWGNLKRIHFYDSIQKYDMVLNYLERIETEGLSRAEKKNLSDKLVQFGDYYVSKSQYDTATAFYKKTLAFFPDYWFLYNKLEKVEREKGRFFINFKNTIRQSALVLDNFKSSFIAVNTSLNIIFFSGFFVFFLFAVILFIKYFKLAANDLLLEKNGTFSKKRALIVCAVIIWPLLLFSGWMIYPFLVAGFLWLYLNENEKKSIVYFLVIGAGISLLYCLNLVIEKSAGNKEFKTIQQVYDGKLFESDAYDKFDNQLKVAQAFSYYENKEYDVALDILISTGEGFVDKLKYDLMGNIYFKADNFAESIKYFNEALKQKSKDENTLNNFTLALLKKNDEEWFKSYSKRYPEINRYMQIVSTLREPVFNSTGPLWKRIFSFSNEKFSVGLLLKNYLLEFVKLPVNLFFLLFGLYLFGSKRMFASIGDSTYCSKCTRIIKEAAIHKSYKLCDECYQLFLIKDVIFLEAKILKEKELSKKLRKRSIIGMYFSFLLPGINLNLKERNRVFILLSLMFYFFLGMATLGSRVFNEVFSTSPLLLNLVGMLAFIIYFVINLISILGDYDGI